jgi:hypothetical protein
MTRAVPAFPSNMSLTDDEPYHISHGQIDMKEQNRIRSANTIRGDSDLRKDRFLRVWNNASEFIERT